MQLFVSYARADKAVADALVADAHALGHHAFYDRELTGGQRWWDALLDQIEAAGVFVPVLSDDYRGSEACRAEAEWAQASGIPFLPVHTAAQSPGLYDPVIAEANWVAFDPASRESLADLARGLAATPPVTPPGAPLTRPPVPVTYLNALEQQIRGVGEISRGDQLALISDLRAKLGSRDDPVARTLLASLRARPEITLEAATAINELLAVVAPTQQAGPMPAAKPTPSRPAPQPTPVAPPRAIAPGGRRLPRAASLSLAAAATLLWVVATAFLPWAPYRVLDGPVRRPRVWESASIVAPTYAVLAVLVAIAISAAAVLAIYVRLPLPIRAAVAAAAAVVGIVAVVRTSTASLAVSAGSGVWAYLAAMVTLAVTTVFTTP